MGQTSSQIEPTHMLSPPAEHAKELTPGSTGSRELRGQLERSAMKSSKARLTYLAKISPELHSTADYFKQNRLARERTTPRSTFIKKNVRFPSHADEIECDFVTPSRPNRPTQAPVVTDAQTLSDEGESVSEAVDEPEDETVHDADDEGVDDSVDDSVDDDADIIKIERPIVKTERPIIKTERLDSESEQDVIMTEQPTPRPVRPSPKPVRSILKPARPILEPVQTTTIQDSQDSPNNFVQDWLNSDNFAPPEVEPLAELDTADVDATASPAHETVLPAHEAASPAHETALPQATERVPNTPPGRKRKRETDAVEDIYDFPTCNRSHRPILKSRHASGVAPAKRSRLEDSRDIVPPPNMQRARQSVSNNENPRPTVVRREPVPKTRSLVSISSDSSSSPDAQCTILAAASQPGPSTLPTTEEPVIVRGPFSPEERAIAQQVFYDVCETHDLDPTELCFRIQKWTDGSAAPFRDALRVALPQRLPRSLMDFSRRAFAITLDDDLPKVTKSPTEEAAQSSTSRRRSSVSVSQPDADRRQPSVPATEPGISGRRRSVSAAEPDATTRRRSVSTAEPVTASKRRPSVSATQPETSSKRPSTPAVQPDTSKRQSSISTIQHNTTRRRSSVSASQPVTGTRRPSISAAQPDVKERRPSTSAVEADFSVRRASVLKDDPTYQTTVAHPESIECRTEPPYKKAWVVIKRAPRPETVIVREGTQQPTPVLSETAGAGTNSNAGLSVALTDYVDAKGTVHKSTLGVVTFLPPHPRRKVVLSGKGPSGRPVEPYDHLMVFDMGDYYDMLKDTLEILQGHWYLIPTFLDKAKRKSKIGREFWHKFVQLPTTSKFAAIEDKLLLARLRCLVWRVALHKFDVPAAARATLDDPKIDACRKFKILMDWILEREGETEPRWLLRMWRAELADCTREEAAWITWSEEREKTWMWEWENDWSSEKWRKRAEKRWGQIVTRLQKEHRRAHPEAYQS